MRWILLLLLAANVAMFGWWQGWFADRSPPQELQPQRLRVVPLGRLGGPSSTPLRQATPEAPTQPTESAIPTSRTTPDRTTNDAYADGGPR